MLNEKFINWQLSPEVSEPIQGGGAVALTFHLHTAPAWCEQQSSLIISSRTKVCCCEIMLSGLRILEADNGRTMDGRCHFSL